MKNYHEYRNSNGSVKDVDSISGAIINAFEWKETPEGNNYWSNVYASFLETKRKSTPRENFLTFTQNWGGTYAGANTFGGGGLVLSKTG